MDAADYDAATLGKNDGHRLAERDGQSEVRGSVRRGVPDEASAIPIDDAGNRANLRFVIAKNGQGLGARVVDPVGPSLRIALFAGHQRAMIDFAAVEDDARPVGGVEVSQGMIIGFRPLREISADEGSRLSFYGLRRGGRRRRRRGQFWKQYGFDGAVEPPSAGEKNLTARPRRCASSRVNHVI
jgi:hypothetical protein